MHAQAESVGGRALSGPHSVNQSACVIIILMVDFTNLTLLFTILCGIRTLDMGVASRVLYCYANHQTQPNPN